jgi:hypothetical protein
MALHVPNPMETERPLATQTWANGRFFVSAFFVPLLRLPPLYLPPLIFAQ